MDSIAVVFYGDPDQYPPTRNIMDILSKRYRVIALVRNRGPGVFIYGKNIEIHRIGCDRLDPLAPGIGPFKRLFEYLRYCFRVWKHVRQSKPKLVYTFDMYAFAAGWLSSRLNGSLPLIYHNHDLASFHDLGLLGILIKRFELRFAKTASKVVFPNRDRAEIFASISGISSPVEIVMNCPLLLPDLPVSRMAETKIQLGIPKEARVAVYQGTVNFGRIPKTLIQSMTSWPKDTYLLIIGPTPDEMKQTILTITGSSSENSRVRYLPWPADHNILPITVGSHLGIGISASTDINMRHIAGASNKFFEYLTCGIPVLVNDFTEIRNLFGYTGCIFGADVLSPADISRAVNEALQINQRPIESARASHRDRFNFQTQFAPVERWIEHLS